MTSYRRKSTSIGIAGAAVLALVLTACGGSHHKAAATSSTVAKASPTPTMTTAPTTPAPAPVNPFTGLVPSTNAVVAVKIDDTGNGRPASNLDQADIVYIEQVEGGLTRLVAIFNSTLPSVEAVRSTRANDPELLAEYGPIAYVASGGAPNPLQVLDHSTLKSSINDRGGPGFSRDPNRPAPYNLVANLRTVATALHTPAAKDIGLTWSATLDFTGDPAASTLSTTVGSTQVGFVWSASLNRYVRVIDGVRQSSAQGKPITAANVIVQFCPVTVYPQDIDVNGNPSQYTHTIGSGHATIFRNGHRIEASWSRPNAAAGTVYKDKYGHVIPMSPGGVWVVLAAAGAALTSS